MSGEGEITQVRARAATAIDRVLIADIDPECRRWLREAVAGSFGLDEVDSGRAAIERIAAHEPRIVVVGRALTDMSGGALLEAAAPWLGDRADPISTFLVTDESGATAEVDESHIAVFYRLVPTMQPARVRELFTQASARLPPRPPEQEREPREAVVAHARRIAAATDVADVATAVIAAARQLLSAERARCLFCDEQAGTLWAVGSEQDAQVSSGLAGFAIRTVATIAVPHAAADPLYRREVDDPDGDGRERLLVQPVVGLDGHVHAAIVAIRGVSGAPFGSDELAIVEELATAWSPYLEELAMSVEGDEILGDRLAQASSELFRQEAVVALMRRGARGDVVRVHPAWVRSAYWIVLASVLGVVAFAALARVHQYTEGPAIVLFTGRSEVIAQEDGTIESVDVERGQRVAQGQVIARLDEGSQAERLITLQREFDQKLVEYMQTPSDPRAVAALTQMRTERETARSALKSRAIVAPRAGVIKELVVRTGQRVEPGKPVAAIVERGATEGLSIYAFLPGGSRSRLSGGQRLVLSLPGYRGALITTTVVAASQEVLSASEARARFLGARYADSVPVTGTVAVVQATLASPAFEADGEHYQLHDGMVGLAEVRLASSSILETLIPGWR